MEKTPRLRPHERSINPKVMRDYRDRLGGLPRGAEREEDLGVIGLPTDRPIATPAP